MDLTDAFELDAYAVTFHRHGFTLLSCTIWAFGKQDGNSRETFYVSSGTHRTMQRAYGEALALLVERKAKEKPPTRPKPSRTLSDLL